MKELAIFICMISILGLIGLATILAFRNVKQGREYNLGALAIPLSGLITLLFALVFFGGN